MAAQRVPQRGHVVLVAVGAGAQPRAVPERDPARAAAAQLAAQPALLRRAAVVRASESSASSVHPPAEKRYQSGGVRPCTRRQ